MDPYKILDIPRNASQDEIKKKYKQMAMKYHPDKTGGDDTQFKELRTAYESLTEQKPSSNTHFNNMNFNNMFDIHNIFEQMHQQRFSRFSEIHLTLEDLYNGKSVKIQNKNINIPAGMSPNSVIRIPELNIDLLIRISKHRMFELDQRNMNLVLNQKITLCEALCGFSFKIQHPSGKYLIMTTPKGKVIQHGMTLRCKEWGLILNSDHSKSYSDLVVNFEVIMPKHFDVSKHEQNLRTIFNWEVPSITKRPNDIEIYLI
jgi:DnaJ-class molecular chaperone